VPGAIVGITTSNLHDPRTNPIAPPQRADAEKLAHGEVLTGSESSDPRAVLRAYAASKLCNIITDRALASSTFARERILRVIAFNPGVTPGTKLTRNHPAVVRLFFAVWPPILSFFQRQNTIAGGGPLLADLSLGRIKAPAGRFSVS
jgi:NAD(P)-dependent dehydrogenase (short-subunit alcohol dehydrogenase family)